MLLRSGTHGTQVGYTQYSPLLLRSGTHGTQVGYTQYSPLLLRSGTRSTQVRYSPLLLRSGTHGTQVGYTQYSPLLLRSGTRSTQVRYSPLLLRSGTHGTQVGYTQYSPLLLRSGTRSTQVGYSPLLLRSVLVAWSLVACSRLAGRFLLRLCFPPTAALGDRLSIDRCPPYPTRQSPHPPCSPRGSCSSDVKAWGYRTGRWYLGDLRHVGSLPDRSASFAEYPWGENEWNVARLPPPGWVG